MRPISQKFKKIINEDIYFKKCIRIDEGICDGRITIDHCFIYAGRQIDELWNFVPVCWYHHLGKGFDKHINQLHSLKRATTDDLAKYPKKDWQLEYKNLTYECNKNKTNFSKCCMAREKI